MADPSTYYWVGADGNVYARSNQFSGVQNVGRAGATTAGGGTAVLHPNGVTTYVHASPDPLPGGNSSGSTGGSTGGSSSGGSSGAAAAQAQAAAQARAEANYHSGLEADTNTINTGISTGAQGLDTFEGDAFHGSGGFASQQRSINDSSIQNELSKAQGLQGVRDMVNNGINGAGVVLDNDNAGTSSAGEAVARAYGIQGRQQASKVGSQYAQGQHTIQTNQQNLNDTEDNFMNKDVPQKKADTINGIVSGATQMLTMLNAMASNGNVTDMVDINQKIAEIKAQATAALAAYDGQLQQLRSSNAPMSPDAAMAEGAKLFTAGTAPAHQFDFTSQMPAQLQNTGPSPSQLPIFIAPNKNDNQPNPAAAPAPAPA